MSTNRVTGPGDGSGDGPEVGPIDGRGKARERFLARERFVRQVLESWVVEQGLPREVPKAIFDAFAFAKTPKGGAIMSLVRREVGAGRKIVVFSSAKILSKQLQQLYCWRCSLHSLFIA
jgi:hypothetical protein